MKKRKGNVKNKTKTLNFCIIFDVCLIIGFVIAMLIIYCVRGGIPDTLCTCFFATAGGELLCTMLITLFKLKYPKDKKEGHDNGDEYNYGGM